MFPATASHLTRIRPPHPICFFCMVEEVICFRVCTLLNFPAPFSAMLLGVLWRAVHRDN